MKLSAKFVDSITTPGRYYDSAAPGLNLTVREKNGHIRKSYFQRLTVQGKRVDIGLGSPKWGATTLTEARQKAMKNYRIARNGGDPRKAKRKVPTFADGVEAVIAIQREAWRNPKSEAQWRASLRDYADGLMTKKLDAIGPADVLTVLVPHWTDKRETMRRVKQRIGAVMKWAIAEGHRDSNPVDAIGAALPKNGAKSSHHKALHYNAVGEALATVRASQAYPTTRLAFEFLVLTAARSGEVRGARWDEIDLNAAVWTVPGDRMKAGRDHRVPLSGRALEILGEVAQHGNGGLLFPSALGEKPMSDATMGKLLKDHGIEAVPHGFRSSFRDWASERTNTPHAVMEAALAHVIKDKAEAAYARSDLLDKRRGLMEAWARFLGNERGKVVTMERKHG